jgi:hypothetical protein
MVPWHGERAGHQAIDLTQAGQEPRDYHDPGPGFSKLRFDGVQPLRRELHVRTETTQELLAAEAANRIARQIPQDRPRQGSGEHIRNGQFLLCREQRGRNHSGLARQWRSEGFKVDHKEDRNRSIRIDKWFDVRPATV